MLCLQRNGIVRARASASNAQTTPANTPKTEQPPKLSSQETVSPDTTDANNTKPQTTK
jgi:hypothetical protein